MIEFKRNPHWYAKYLLYFERPQKAVDYLNEYFQRIYGTPFTESFDEAYFLDSPLDFTFNPALYNIFLLRMINKERTLAVKDNLGTNYGIVYQDICKWLSPGMAAALLSTLNLEKKEEDELHEGSEDRMIEALEALHASGWIVFSLGQDTPVKHKYSGRLILDPIHDHSLYKNPNFNHERLVNK